LNQFYVVNGAIYLIACYDFVCKPTIVLGNRPTTIAMSSVCGSKLAHTTDPITPWSSRQHWRTPNQTRTQLLFYSIRV